MASFKCEVCNYRETLYDDEVDVSTQGASCSAAGETVYTATVTLEGEPYTNEKHVTLEKLPHTPGAYSSRTMSGDSPSIGQLLFLTGDASADGFITFG